MADRVEDERNEAAEDPDNEVPVQMRPENVIKDAEGEGRDLKPGYEPGEHRGRGRGGAAGHVAAGLASVGPAVSARGRPPVHRGRCQMRVDWTLVSVLLLVYIAVLVSLHVFIRHF